MQVVCKGEGVEGLLFIPLQGGIPLGGGVGYPEACIDVRVRVGSFTRKNTFVL